MAPPLLKWKILSKKTLAHEVFELKIEKPEGFKFKAGQYISIVIPGAGPGGRNLRRAYSIASAPEQEEIELCIKKVEGGPATTYLDNLEPGEFFEAQAPFGDFCLDHSLDLPCIFIGTGTGIAPFRSMVLSNEWRANPKVGFLLGVRSEQDILYPELFLQEKARLFQQSPHIRIALSRPQEHWIEQNPEVGFHGRVTQYLQQLEWEFTRSHFYLCGSGAMIQEVKDFLMQKKSVLKDHIHTEKYF